MSFLRGSVFKEFEQDPFFNFNGSGFPEMNFPEMPAIEFNASNGGGRSHGRHDKGRDRHALAKRDEYFGDDGFGMGGMMQPFAQMENMFGGMNKMMAEMRNMASQPDQNGFCMSSSSVYRCDNTGSEPKVYQAHHSVRQAPGGYKEERKAMRDSESGEEKMHLGQHIREKGRIYQKSRNTRTNQYDENKEYLGMAENEESDFERQWRDKTGSGSYLGEPSYDNRRRAELIDRPRDRRPAQGNAPLAITDGKKGSRHAGRSRDY